MRGDSDRIIVVGDVHADYSSLNQFINRQQPTLLIACGDFGFWPKFRPPLHDLKPGDCKVLFAEGNHEDYASLPDTRSPTEVMPGLTWQPRGSTHVLPDGRTILFMGGAASIDREFRTKGENVSEAGWFEREIIDASDMAALPDCKVDIVISHTCPAEFPIPLNLSPCNDPSRWRLSSVLDRYRPKLWYFGHFHVHCFGQAIGCRWRGLPCLGDPYGWRELDRA